MKNQLQHNLTIERHEQRRYPQIKSRAQLFPRNHQLAMRKSSGVRKKWKNLKVSTKG